MKQPLPTVCALLCAVACCAGQAGDATQKVPPASTVPAQETAPVRSTPPVAVPPAEAATPDANALKPGCDVEKPPAADATSAKPYVIGSLDVLDIRVWNSANLSGMVDVGPDGMISLPLIGQIKADGETQASLMRTIQNKLVATVFECPPPVNVQVVRVNSKKYYIYGGVNRQGEFPLTGEMTVMDAFANCGGFKDFANPKKVYILRGDKRLNFNYREVSHAKNMSQNIKLENGDRIFVPE